MTNIILIGASSLIIALSGAMMPGPLFALTVSESPRRGWLAGPVLVAGHACLELFLVLLIISGLGSFLRLEETFILVSILGGIFLLFTAFSMLKSLHKLTLKGEEISQKKGSLFLGGILLSLANPYWSLWWATIGVGYLVKSMELGLQGFLAFFTGHVLGDLVWYTAVSVSVFKGKKILNDSLYRKLSCLCAILLIGFSIYFIFSGIDKLKSLLNNFN